MYLIDISKHFLKKIFREVRCSLCHLPFISQFSTFITNANDKQQFHINLCPSCEQLLQPRKTGYCPQCGELTLYKSSPIAICNQCIKEPPKWNHFLFLGAYADEYKKLLIQAKFKGNPSILQLLGRLLANHCLKLPQPDVIIPMPLHPIRLNERGFNQCQELAKPISQLLHIPLTYNLLKRINYTEHQTGLSQPQRIQNITNAFKVTKNVKNMRVLLVDDVMTTGTTLKQATNTLLNNNAFAVDICVVARTPSFIKQ